VQLVYIKRENEGGRKATKHSNQEKLFVAARICNRQLLLIANNFQRICTTEHIMMQCDQRWTSNFPGIDYIFGIGRDMID
jgi:hypothetical protein